MKKIIERILKIFAKLILNKYRPKVVGVTGSLGKTSTKEAIATVLKSKFKVRSSYKNYNTEIGMPLTIIGCASPGKSVFKWFRVFAKAIKKILVRDKDYPSVLVLEMAADYPGDIKYLLSIVRPEVSVITAIQPVHLEKFKKFERIIKEKGLLALNVKKNGFVVLNFDDENIKKLQPQVKERIISYGMENKDVDVVASEVSVKYDKDKEEVYKKIGGMTFKISSQGSVVPAYIKGVVGKQNVYATLAAVGVGLAFKMNLLEISQALSEYHGVPGRMRLIEGIKRTLLIDDSYNSAPKSCQKAIEALIDVKLPGRKWAVLGDMLELSNISEAEHLRIGEMINSNDIDFLVTVGSLANDFKKGAKKSGFPDENIYSFDYSSEAGEFIQKQIEKGDIVLIKGSQGARMEKITKELMADPLHASELIVRQTKKWLKS